MEIGEAKQRPVGVDEIVFEEVRYIDDAEEEQKDKEPIWVENQGRQGNWESEDLQSGVFFPFFH